MEVAFFLVESSIFLQKLEHIASVKVFVIYVQNMLSSPFSYFLSLFIVPLDPVHFGLEIAQIEMNRNIVFPCPGKDVANIFKNIDFEYYRRVAQQCREPSRICVSVNINDNFIF